MLLFIILILICFNFSFSEVNPSFKFKNPYPEDLYFKLNGPKRLPFEFFGPGAKSNVLFDIYKDGKRSLEESARISENRSWTEVIYCNLVLGLENNCSLLQIKATVSKSDLQAVKNLTIYIYENETDIPPDKRSNITISGEEDNCGQCCDSSDEDDINYVPDPPSGKKKGPNSTKIIEIPLPIKANDYSAAIIITALACFIILVIVSAMVFYAVYARFISEGKIPKLSKEIIDQFNNGDNSPDVNPDREPVRYTREPYKREFEIPKRRLTFGKELGKGNFGVVRQGEWNTTSGEVLKVACKTVKKPDAALLKNEEEKKKFERKFDYFLREIKYGQNIGHHDNIVRYFGSVTKNIEFFEAFLIVELCLDNLEDILRSQSGIRRIPVGYSIISELEPSKPDLNLNITITKDDLLGWAIDIASGMEYLSSKWIIHCDLAAHNIVLSYKGDKLIAKIMDFGLSRHLEVTEECDSDGMYYKICKETTYIPALWMAPEVLKNGKIFASSDVWSFGVTLWEIFSLGQTPYLLDELSQHPAILYNRLEQGERLDIPSHATDEIYNIMMECWQIVREERPKFDYLKERLISLQKEQEPSNS